MEKITALLRHMFSPPRPEFSRRLKKTLLKKFSGNQKILEGQLYFLLPQVPKTTFEKQLRKRLLSSVPRKKRVFSSHIFSSFRAPALLLAPIFLFFTFAAIGFFPTGSASGKTILSSFSGDVEVNGARVTEKNTPLSPSYIIATRAQSSAVLSFFEDSLVRMDEHTSIRLDTLAPHPLRPDLGEVELTLLSGRIWVKNASSDERYSRFLVNNEKYRVVLDFGGAVEISANKQEYIVRVWDKIARVIDGEREILLAQGEEYFASFFIKKRRDIAEHYAQDDLWVAYNLQEDAMLANSFLFQKIEAQNAATQSALEKIKSVFSGTDADMQEIEDFFFDTLSLLAHGKSTDTTTFIRDFRKKVLDFSRISPQKTEAFLVSAEKSLSFVPPRSPLFSIREQITHLREEIAQSVIAREKVRTQQLWNARLLARAGHTDAAQHIIQRNISTDTDTSSEVLEERELQMVALGEMEKDDALEDIAENAQTLLVQKTQKTLTRPGFPTRSQMNTRRKAEEVIRIVKKYTSETGQRNTLIARLRAIPNTTENLALVLEIKKRLPEHLRNIAKRKILDILAAERKKH